MAENTWGTGVITPVSGAVPSYTDPEIHLKFLATGEDFTKKTLLELTLRRFIQPK